MGILEFILGILVAILGTICVIAYLGFKYGNAEKRNLYKDYEITKKGRN